MAPSPIILFSVTNSVHFTCWHLTDVRLAIKLSTQNLAPKVVFDSLCCERILLSKGLLWGRLGAYPKEVPGGHQRHPASTTPWGGCGWGVKFDMSTRQIANQNTAWRGENIYFYPFLVGASWRREPWRQPRGDKFYEIQNWHWVPNFSCLEMMETLGCRGWSRSSWKLDRGRGCQPRSLKTDSFCSEPKKLMDTLLVACAILYT